MIKNEHVIESLFVVIKRIGPVAIESDQQAFLNIDTALSRDLSENRTKENAQILRSDVLYTENLKLDGAQNDVAL